MKVGGADRPIRKTFAWWRRHGLRPIGRRIHSGESGHGGSGTQIDYAIGYKECWMRRWWPQALRGRPEMVHARLLG